MVAARRHLIGAGLLLLSITPAQAQLAYRLQDCLAAQTDDVQLHICSIMSGTDAEKVEGGLIASEILRGRGDFETAVDLLNNLGSDIRLQAELGHVRFEAGEMVLADYHFEMALLEGYQADVETTARIVSAAFLYGGELLYSADNAEDALRTYDCGLALDPDHLPTLLDRSAAAQRLDQHAEAMRSLDHAISLGADWTGYLMRARSRQALGDIGGAITDYRQVITDNPGHTGAMVALEELER